MPKVEFSQPDAPAGEMLTLMMYPDDENNRRGAFVAGEVRRLTLDPDASPLVLQVADARALLDTPRWADLKREQAERTKKGFVAGYVLAALYLADRFRAKSHYFVPSLNRAIFVAQWLAAEGGTFGDSTPMPRSDRTIRDYWLLFAPVAHYWAATAMAGLGYAFADRRSLFSAENFPRFLGVSASLYQFGTTFIPDGARPPLPVLDTAKTYAPPDGTRSISLNSDRVPDRLLKALRAYRAPKK